MKPLEGIRILDLSHMLPGPFCTMLLADMGAEVIKIENPKGGDSFRGRAPFLKKEGTAFLMTNRNKKSAVVNLKSPEGHEFFMKLAETADVILEQFKPGTVQKLGVDYEAVKKRNPRIIYCSLSGYGQSGPYVSMPGHDINYLSLAGVLDTMGYEQAMPTQPGIQVADLAASQWTLTSILFALFARQKDNEGRYLDISMTRCIVPWMNLYLSQYAADRSIPERGSTKAGGHFACYRVYETSDHKYVSIGAAEPKFFARFCELVGHPEWAQDQYTEGPRRLELIEEVAALLASNTQAYWCELLMKEETCFTPVRTFDEVVGDEGVLPASMLQPYTHPAEGEVFNIGFPVDIPGVETVCEPAPALGAHTAQLLAELKYSPEAIESYLAGCSEQR